MQRHPELTTAVVAERGREPWTTLLLLGLAQFMVITVVNVALPSIADELAFAAGDLQWVITAYVLFTVRRQPADCRARRMVAALVAILALRVTPAVRPATTAGANA